MISWYHILPKIFNYLPDLSGNGNLMIYLKNAGRVVNSVDPDQMPLLRHLIKVYTVCSGLSVAILRVNMIHCRRLVFQTDLVVE